MWSRNLSKNLKMDCKDFTTAFVNALKDQTVIKSLQKAVCGELIKEVQYLRDLVVAKEQRIDGLEKRIKELELSADNQEQYSRRNSLRIFGLEENENKTTEQIVEELMKADLEMDIDHSSIDRVHRVGKPAEDRKTPRPILIKFSTYRERARVYKAKKLLKEKKIFINEDLTKKRVKLLYKLRQLKKEKAILDCWTSDGQILIKTKRGQVQQINGEEDLLKYK